VECFYPTYLPRWWNCRRAGDLVRLCRFWVAVLSEESSLRLWGCSVSSKFFR
jgi:hypothetical protein